MKGPQSQLDTTMVMEISMPKSSDGEK